MEFSHVNKKRKRFDDLLWNKDTELNDNEEKDIVRAFQKSTPKKLVISSPKIDTRKMNPFVHSKPQSESEVVGGNIDNENFIPELSQETIEGDLQLDWTLKSNIHIVSPTSLSTIEEKLDRFMNYYTYPYRHFPNAVVRYFRSISSKDSKNDEDLDIISYWQDVRTGWCDSIKSLMHSVFKGDIEYFYVIYAKHSILISKNNKNIIAFINCSTGKLRKKLTLMGVSFNLPFCLDNDPLKLDQTINSGLLIESQSDIELMIKCLQDDVLDDISLPTLPILYTTKPFLNAAMCKNTTKQGEISVLKDDKIEKGYTIDINGIIMPYDFMSIIELLKRETLEFFAKITELKQTRWINGVKNYITDEDSKLGAELVDSKKFLAKIDFKSDIVKQYWVQNIENV